MGRVFYMARPIVLSNGELHVGLNSWGLVHDFYFPYVGLENHASGKSLRHKIGVWVEGRTSWIDDDADWNFDFQYPHTALIGHTTARNEKLGILLEFDDTVDSELSVFMRNIHVINLFDTEREVRLFMHQAFAIGDGRSNTDTAQYLPDSNSILHYRGRRAFIISGESDRKPFDQHSIGLFGLDGHEGTFRDAEDGELSNGNVEHGRVDSTIRFVLNIKGHSSERVHYWIAAGTSIREALFVDKKVRESSLSQRLDSTAKWWQKWLSPAIEVSNKLPEKYRQHFIQSVMIIKSQIDKRGAVIASTDTTMLNYSRDAYAYSWPRDGAYVLWPLIRMGYVDEAVRFFEFCKRGLHPGGYLLHKYRADGAQGSSWHPYVHDGEVGPPIQEDETALVLFVYAQFHQLQPKAARLKDFYKSMVIPMAEFLTEYIDHSTGLPRASYDLWEEVYLTTTYTTSTVYAALLAAAELAEAQDDSANAVRWRAAADDIYTAAHKHLYNPDRKAFYKGVRVRDGEITRDDTVDMSSIFGAFMFGLFTTGSHELTSSVDTARAVFGHKDGAFKLPRYENDHYQRTSDSYIGNYWFITSLWLAQYYLELDKPEEALATIDWVGENSLPTGIISEQLNPTTNQSTSVSPLTWSHAELVATLLDTITDKE